MKRALHITALAATLGLSSSAAAQSPTWSLTWAAPAACPSDAALRERVGAMLGDRGDPAAPVHMTAAVEALPSGRWGATLRTEAGGAPGTRTLVAPTCPALADAVTVILAWMIDPALRAPAPPIAPVRSASASSLVAATLGPVTPLALAAPIAATEPPPRPPLPNARLTPERARPLLALEGPWRVGLSLGARGDLGALPSFAVGAALRVSIARGRWRLFADGSWRPTVRRELSQSPSVGGDFDLFTVGLGACHRWVARPLTPAVCAGFEAGALAAAGFGVTRPGSDRQPWLAAWAGGALELPVTAWLTLSARASLSAPLVRPAFTLRGVGDVFQPSPVGLRSEIDAEVTF